MQIKPYMFDNSLYFVICGRDGGIEMKGKYYECR